MAQGIHRLLVKIAFIHAEIISWSVTVGTDFSLTVNFADRKERAEHNSDFRDQTSYLRKTNLACP
jgi:hypothetical protein